MTHAKITSEAGVRTPRMPRTSCERRGRPRLDRPRPDRRPPPCAQGDGGTAEDIRGCISCNQMCWGRRSRDYWISCLINPSAGREFEWGGDRSPRPRRPAACWSWVRGRRGSRPRGLPRRTGARGGHRRGPAAHRRAVPPCGPAAAPGADPGPDGLVRTAVRETGRHPALNTFLDEGEIAAHPADTVILATGSCPTRPASSAGCRRNRACRAWRTAMSTAPRRSCGARRGRGTR